MEKYQDNKLSGKTRFKKTRVKTVYYGTEVLTFSEILDSVEISVVDFNISVN